MHHISTGCNAVSPRQNIHRADNIGMIHIAAPDAQELSLRASVVRRDAAAAVWTGAARVVRQGESLKASAVLWRRVSQPQDPNADRPRRCARARQRGAQAPMPCAPPAA